MKRAAVLLLANAFFCCDGFVGRSLVRPALAPTSLRLRAPSPPSGEEERAREEVKDWTSKTLDSGSSSKPFFAGCMPLVRGASLPVALTMLQSQAAAALDKNSFIPLSTGQFDPDKFKPVCSASDGFYRALQGSTQAVIGPENYVEYGPLIAGGLLRVRLELCVVESYFNEAVLPFIKQNGLSWVLPLHETVETFVAGTIFALASTFILVGSTKLVTVIVTYADLFLGGPCRIFGGFVFDRAQGKPVTLDVGFGFFKTRLIGPKIPKEEEKRWRRSKSDDDDEGWDVDWDKLDAAQIPVVVASGSVKGVGEVSKFTRQVMDSIDSFVGRYLVLLMTGYVAVKFLHFKIFPNFPFS